MDVTPTDTTGESCDDKPSRFNWDFEATDAFVLLHSHFVASASFVSALSTLFESSPKTFKSLRFSAFDGHIPDNGSEPSILDLLVPSDDTKHGVPGDITHVTNRYRAIEAVVRKEVGDEDDWFRKIEKAKSEWGLNSPWGFGWLLETCSEQHMSSERAESQMTTDDDLWTFFNTPLIMRTVPNRIKGTPELRRPWLRPGMTNEEWKQEIARYEHDGLRVLDHWRKVLPDSELWGANPTRLSEHVKWLFLRITPPYLSPFKISEMEPKDGEKISESAVKAANGKTAALLNLRISPGMRRQQAKQGLSRSKRRKVF